MAKIVITREGALISRPADDGAREAAGAALWKEILSTMPSTAQTPWEELNGECREAICIRVDHVIAAWTAALISRPADDGAREPKGTEEFPDVQQTPIDAQELVKRIEDREDAERFRWLINEASFRSEWLTGTHVGKFTMNIEWQSKNCGADCNIRALIDAARAPKEGDKT